jgi:hypothetical protein
VVWAEALDRDLDFPLGHGRQTSARQFRLAAYRQQLVVASQWSRRKGRARRGVSSTVVRLPGPGSIDPEFRWIMRKLGMPTPASDVLFPEADRRYLASVQPASFPGGFVRLGDVGA